MQRLSSAHRATTAHHAPSRISPLFAALTLALALWCAATSVAHAQGPGGNGGRAPGGRLNDPVVRAVDLAAPAVVRVATIYASHITLDVCGTTVTLPNNANGYPEGAIGSGAFVSANGDILTADHLVTVDHATLEQQLFADPSAQADIASTLDASPCYNYGPVVTPDDIGGGFLQSSGVEYVTTFTSPKTYIWRDTWYSGELPTPSSASPALMQALLSIPHLQATTLASSDFTHDDLALLHVNVTNTPSIQLDDSANVQALDSLTVIGFPANGDANNDPNNLLTPSFNLANVSAIKTDSDGAELIQVGGNIEHGDSGGPALDASGRIVGVVSFGGADNQGITAFLRSSDSARRLLTTAGVSNDPGALQRAWRQAFDDYAATTPGHWQRAARELAALLKAYPQFQGAAPYAAWAERQARHETTPRPSSPPSSPPLLLTVALGALATLDMALIMFTLLRAGKGQDISQRYLALARLRVRNPTPPRKQEPLTPRHSAVMLGACEEEASQANARLN